MRCCKLSNLVPPRILTAALGCTLTFGMLSLAAADPPEPDQESPSKSERKESAKKTKAGVRKALQLQGKLVQVAENRVRVALGNNLVQSFEVGTNTVVTLDGKRAELSALQPGDRIQLQVAVEHSEKQPQRLLLSDTAAKVEAMRRVEKQDPPRGAKIAKKLREEKKAARGKEEKQPMPGATESAKKDRKESKGRAQLGVAVLPADDGKPRVVMVEPGSPAARAGLQQGDTILAVNGKKVASPKELVSVVEKLTPGEKITVQVESGDQQRTLEVKLAASRVERREDRPAETEPPADERPLDATPWLGLLIRPGEDQGVYIARVYLGSPAFEAGLRPGDRILKAAGHEVDSPQSLADRIREMKPGSKVEMVVSRDGEQQQVTVEVGNLANFHQRLFGQQSRKKLGDFRQLFDPNFDGAPERSLRMRPRLDRQGEAGAEAAPLRSLMREMINEMRMLRKQLRGEGDQGADEASPGQKKEEAKREPEKKTTGNK